jgi:hypothetical protein
MPLVVQTLHPRRRPLIVTALVLAVLLPAAGFAARRLDQSRPRPSSVGARSKDSATAGPASTTATRTATPTPVSKAGSAPGPITSAAQPPVSKGTPAVLIAQDGSQDLAAYAGPSNRAFDALTSAFAGQSVTVLCTAYGEAVKANGGTGRLWDYTSEGWFSDQVVQTGQSAGVQPGCLGDTAHPTVGVMPPDRNHGPFAVISDDQVVVRASPDTASRAITRFGSGSLVLVRCSRATGTRVAPPTRLAYAGGNDHWDRIDSPASGWIPDSFVISSTVGSAASAC